MARWFEPRPDQEEAWRAWVAERPAEVREVAQRFVPWELYGLRSTGQRVSLASFTEPADGRAVTVKVNVLAGEMPGPVYQVFGIDPDDLEPYDPTSMAELVALARRAAGD